jgi:flagellar hook protein FlgE
MWSGVAGLRAHQTRMDVIGNDIANVNTVAYKNSDVTFKEQLVNTIRAPAPGSLGEQIGMGVQIGSVTRNFQDGVLMETGQASNIAVSGNGFYVVGDTGAAAPAFYTRAGDFVFTTNAAGTNTYLLNGSGKQLWGYDSTATVGADGTYTGTLIPIDLQAAAPAGEKVESVAISASGEVTVNYVGTTTTGTFYIPLAMFNNNVGLKSEGSNLFSNATLAAGPATYQQAGSTGVGTLYQGYLENSNVDLAKEFTEMIITERGFQANSRSITTGDEMLQELLSLKR